MKNSVILFFAIILFATTISAEACDLQTTLLNQDPYPAVPGDYVKLVFQVVGFENPECRDMTFELLADYPIAFNPGETGLQSFSHTAFIQDYESNILIPYEVRVDGDALDGENPIEVRINEQNRNYLETFNLEVKDVKADFEIYVRDYKYGTQILTLEILNIEKVNIEALTVTIPEQENIVVKGPFNVIVGDLDSNEYTTADFEAVLIDGMIEVMLTYTDSINERRTVNKQVNFDSDYFTNRAADKKETSIWNYVILGLVVLWIVYWLIKRKRKKAKK